MTDEPNVKVVVPKVLSHNLTPSTLNPGGGTAKTQTLKP